MKKRILSALIILLFAFITFTGVTYAWWNLLTNTQSEIIGIGEGDTIIVSETSAGNGILIPTNEIATNGEVTEIVYTYEVSVNQESVNAGSTTLVVSESNVLIGGNSTYANLVNFTYSGIGEVSTTTITITVTITLTAPVDQTAYNAITNQNITFDLIFTVS